MGDLTLSDIFRSGELGFGGSIRNEKDGGGMGTSAGLRSWRLGVMIRCPLKRKPMSISPTPNLHLRFSYCLCLCVCWAEVCSWGKLRWGLSVRAGCSLLQGWGVQADWSHSHLRRLHWSPMFLISPGRVGGQCHPQLSAADWCSLTSEPRTYLSAAAANSRILCHENC